MEINWSQVRQDLKKKDTEEGAKRFMAEYHAIQGSPIDSILNKIGVSEKETETSKKRRLSILKEEFPNYFKIPGGLRPFTGDLNNVYILEVKTMDEETALLLNEHEYSWVFDKSLIAPTSIKSFNVSLDLNYLERATILLKTTYKFKKTSLDKKNKLYNLIKKNNYSLIKEKTLVAV